MDDHPAVPPAQRRHAAAQPGRPLGDDDLADEIELYGAVVVAASAKDGELSADEIDDALGVPRAAADRAQERCEDGAGGAPRRTPGALA